MWALENLSDDGTVTGIVEGGKPNVDADNKATSLDYG